MLLKLSIISCDKRLFVKVKGAYHYAKIFGNFGREINEILVTKSIYSQL